MSDVVKVVTGGVVLIFVLIGTVGAWLQHIFTCLSDGSWGFLIAGAILPPIGMVHGWGVWLGVW